jgi:hypothetical protein
MSISNFDLVIKEFKNQYIHNSDWEIGSLYNPEYKGKSTNLRSGLTTIARIIGAKNVLEFGSYHYETSSAVANTIDEMFGKDSPGIIDSFDIRKGGAGGGITSEGVVLEIKPTNKRVVPHFWRPHHSGKNHPRGWHDAWKYDASKTVHPDFKAMTDDEIFKLNAEYLLSIAPENGYDLILIDSDHSYSGATFDWRYSNLVSRSDTIIVIDNIVDQRPALYDVFRFFDDLDAKKYDFKDWNDLNKDRNMVQDMGIIEPQPSRLK